MNFTTGTILGARKQGQNLASRLLMLSTSCTLVSGQTSVTQNLSTLHNEKLEYKLLDHYWDSKKFWKKTNVFNMPKIGGFE